MYAWSFVYVLVSQLTAVLSFFRDCGGVAVLSDQAGG